MKTVSIIETEDWKLFCGWFPEINDRLIKNVTVSKVELTMNDGSVMRFVRHNSEVEQAKAELLEQVAHELREIQNEKVYRWIQSRIPNFPSY